MLNYFIFLQALSLNEGLRVQQRALDLLNSSSQLSPAPAPVVTKYAISDNCVQWAGGHGSVRDCFPKTVLGDQLDWVSVLMFLFMHPYRCINGMQVDSSCTQDCQIENVQFGADGNSAHHIIQVPYAVVPTGQSQFRCLFTSQISPVKIKALVDPFRLVGWGANLGGFDLSNRALRYLDPYGFFGGVQPAMVSLFGTPEAPNPACDVQTSSYLLTGTSAAGTSMVAGSTIKEGSCYQMKAIQPAYQGGSDQGWGSTDGHNQVGEQNMWGQQYLLGSEEKTGFAIKCQCQTAYHSGGWRRRRWWVWKTGGILSTCSTFNAQSGCEESNAFAGGSGASDLNGNPNSNHDLFKGDSGSCETWEDIDTSQTAFSFTRNFFMFSCPSGGAGWQQCSSWSCTDYP